MISICDEKPTEKQKEMIHNSKCIKCFQPYDYSPILFVECSKRLLWWHKRFGVRGKAPCSSFRKYEKSTGMKKYEFVPRMPREKSAKAIRLKKFLPKDHSQEYKPVMRARLKVFENDFERFVNSATFKLGGYYLGDMPHLHAKFFPRLIEELKNNTTLK